MISTGNLDLHRAQYHNKEIQCTALPLLLDLETVSEAEQIPHEWIYQVAKMFGILLAELSEAESNSQEM